MTTVSQRRQMLLLALLTSAGAAFAQGDEDEDVGTSTSGLSVDPGAQRQPPASTRSRLHGEFVIHNPTGFDVGYSVRWGDGAWVPHQLKARHLRRHWHVLDGNGRAPHPQLRFDTVANDNRYTGKTYDMKFGRVGSTPQGPVNQPIEYRFISHGSVIDLVR